MAEKPFFVIPTPLGTVTSGNELDNRPASYLGEFNYAGMVWQSDGSSSLWAKANLGAASPIDFVGMMGANAGSGTTIRVRLGDSEAEVDGGSAPYDSGAVAFINPTITRDDGLYHSHLELPSVQTRQWIRVDIGGHSGDFQASMLVAGQKIEPVQYYETQWNRDVRDLGSITFARNGVAGIARGRRLRATGFRLSWVNELEMEETFSPLDERVGKTDPLFLCFDPAASIYRQRRTFLGYLEENPSFVKRGYNRFERDFKFLSLF